MNSAAMFNGILRAHARADVATATAVQAAEADSLRAALAEARAGYDPAYAYSDDYSYWAAQSARWSRICDLERRLAALGAA